MVKPRLQSLEFNGVNTLAFTLLVRISSQPPFDKLLALFFFYFGKKQRRA